MRLRVLERLLRRPLAHVAVNLVPRRSAYGGGNQFVEQLCSSLRTRGYRVGFRLDDSVDAVVLVEARDEWASFGVDALLEHRLRRPDSVCLHRVNECDKRKGTEFMDRALARANHVADHTIFISRWLRDHHAERWFDRQRPHSVVENGADTAIFHPLGAVPPSPPFRLVTHHWSDNPRKGFDVYARIDEMIAAGELPELELWVIGRWPSGIGWRRARTFPPTRGHHLAGLLRQCHAYVTASLWEPGGMHFIEAAQCGLPVLFHEDGGGIVEVASRFGVGFRDDLAQAIATLRARHAELRAKVLEAPPSGDAMCLEYCRVVQWLLAARARPSAAAPGPFTRGGRSGSGTG